MRYGNNTSSTELGGGDGKNRGRRKSDDDGVPAFIARSRHTETTAQQLLHASATPKKATGATGMPRKLTDGEVSPVGTVHNIYRIATRLIFQITPKFIW